MDAKTMKQTKSNYSESLECMIKQFGKLISENKYVPKTKYPNQTIFNENLIDVGEYEYLD